MSEEKRIIKGDKQYDPDVRVSVLAPVKPFASDVVATVDVVDGDTGRVIKDVDPKIKALATSFLEKQNYVGLMQEAAVHALNEFPGGVAGLNDLMARFPQYAEKIVAPYIQKAQLLLTGTETINEQAALLKDAIKQKADAAVAPHQESLKNVLQGLEDIGSGLANMAKAHEKSHQR